MMLIGLTGSMASGKSTVAAMLRKAQIPVIDADDLARQVCKPGSPVLKKIVEKFGLAILDSDGSLNRGALATLVFDNPNSLKNLEEIVHPAIHHLFLLEVSKLKEQKVSVAVYMAPLLFEKNLDPLFDKIILVTAPENILLDRVIKRDNMTLSQAKKRLKQQLSTEEKALRADEIIDNSGTKEELFMQIKNVWKKLGNKELEDRT